MARDDAKVVFSPGSSGPEVSEKRPYTIVFVSDLGAGPGREGLTSVDKDNFADFVRSAGVTLPVAVKNPLGGGEWEFALSFDSIRAFDPIGLLKQTPAGRWRLGLREKVIERQNGTITSADFQSALGGAAAGDASLAWVAQVETDTAAAPRTPAAAPPSGGNVLDMVDAPSDRSRAAADVERMAAAAGDPNARIPSNEAGRLGSILNRLDRELGQIADTLLKHPQIRRMETTWRGLKMMVEQMDFREGVRLNVLHARREEAVDRLIEKVFTPAFDGEIPTPGLVVFDYSIVNTPVDIELIDYLGQHAASLPVPAVFPIEPAFFDVKTLRMLRNLMNFSSLTEGANFAKWKSLREKPYAKALVPVVGRFILRGPYEGKPGGREFAFTETIGAISDLLWAHGHIAMAICAARSYANHGWPTRMFGVEAGKIDNLPVVHNPNNPQEPWGPGDLALPDRRLDELPEIGLNLLMSVPNSDRCQLMGGVAAARPMVPQGGSKRDAALEISLPYQQFQNIASAFIFEQVPKLHGLAGTDIQRRLLTGLSDLMKLKPEETDKVVAVGVGESPDQPGKTVVQVKLVPPGSIAPGGLEMSFAFAV
jgi:type VI secretion system protein ImpC